MFALTKFRIEDIWVKHIATNLRLITIESMNSSIIYKRYQTREICYGSIEKNDTKFPSPTKNENKRALSKTTAGAKEMGVGKM